MSRRGLRVVVASVSFVAWTGTATAWAQDETPPANFGPPPPGHEPPPPWSPGDSQAAPVPVVSDVAPTFMTLDRMDANTRVGVQVGFDKWDMVEDVFFMRLNPYGQVILPGTKVGLYGQAAISHAFVDDGEDGTGFNNFELGGFYMPLPRSNDLILRGGLIAATATSDGTGAAANVLSAYERVTDVLLAQPEYTTARLSASTIQQYDQLFFRADGGFDFVISRPSAATDQPSVFFRANVAGGYRIPDVLDLTAELVNIATVNGEADGITDRFIHSLGLSLRTTGVDQFHVGGVFLLDEDIRGDLWILSLGYQRAWM